MKIQHMANQYNWGDDEKLNKVVEAFQDKALTFYRNLLANIYEKYSLVKKKFST